MAAERKEAGAASQVRQVVGLSQQRASACKTSLWAGAAAETEALFMSKFTGNLSLGGGGGETDTGVEAIEAGSGSFAGDDVFRSMDAECKVCMQESKVRHQVAYSVDDLHVNSPLH